MNRNLKNFISAILAGIIISISCIVYLSIDNKIIGSILFALGLLTILTFKLNLFTGKAPYICENGLKYSGFVGIVWIGNFIGTGLSALAIHMTKVYDSVIAKCYSMAAAKVSDSVISLFILSIFCGMLMYIAVDTFNKHSQDKNFSASILTILCVSVFILSGYEHSIANMFYFMLTLPITSWIIPLLIITFGNVVGGNLFCLASNLLREST